MEAGVGQAAGASPTLRVIGVGLGRTGTFSLRQALVRLGFGPCEHMHENFDNPERFPLWEEALRRKQAGEPIDWRPLLDGYQAAVDWPSAHFWRELAAAHPEAKVILTVRDPERWYASIQETIFPHLTQLMKPGESGLPGEIIINNTFGRRIDDRAHCQAVFAQHNAAVQDAIPPERLLLFEVREGWAPLCAFLGVSAPEEPFPNTNDIAAFLEDVKWRRE